MQKSVSSDIERIHGRPLRLFQDEHAIANRIQEMGSILTQVHRGNSLIVIGIMHGAFMFTADLVRAIKLPCKVDFWRLSSYGDNITSTKSVKEIMTPTLDLHEKHVILVEDIVDSGTTLSYVRQELKKRGPKSVTTVSLVKVKGSPVDVDYVGFISSGEFIVGYGLDIAQELRELPALYYLDTTSFG
ncbi:MAG: hypoxanthine phosphoribosyltransferase [Bacteroidetes bacterium]|nr:hypoxanthine phosphoribosyltransferase [Bacteroidota bacterium]